MSESHSMKMGGEKSGEKHMPTPEEQNQLEVKRVTAEEFPKMVRQIRGLTRNALNTHEGTGLSERQEDVTGLDSKYLEAAKRGELFVGVKNDVVIAFVALTKTGGGDDKKAVIDQVRFAAGLVKPGRVIRGVLHHVKESLKKEGVLRAEIEIEGKHHRISSAESPEFKEFYENIDSNDSSDALEVANDNMPAANDNLKVPHQDTEAANDNFKSPDVMGEPEEDIPMAA